MKLNSLLLCVGLVFFYEIQALNPDDKGVCAARISSKRPKRVSYSVSVWRNGRRRWMKKYKTEYILVWTNHAVCCQGWQHDGERDICTPVCSTGCLNGTCVAPSLCQCDAPLYLDPERQNACLTPVCDPPCINSVCNSNNICECEPNTRRFNKTHCAQCDEHHDITPELTCKPICDVTCINGECTAPNMCSCLEGYTSIDHFTCVPLCEKCVNSSCVAPNVCSCLEGYVAVDETTCVPKCDSCSNGDCVAPGVCQCLDGYSDENGSCEPVCDIDCVNGFCSAPNECSCNVGFVLKEIGLCSKPCQPECNGTCDLEGRCPSGFCYDVVE